MSKSKVDSLRQSLEHLASTLSGVEYDCDSILTQFNELGGAGGYRPQRHERDFLVATLRLARDTTNMPHQWKAIDDLADFLDRVGLAE